MKNSWQMVTTIEENSRRANLMDQVSIYGSMDQSTRENLRTVFSTDMAFGDRKTMIATKDNIKIIKSMEKEHIPGVTDSVLQESSIKTRIS